MIGLYKIWHAHLDPVHGARHSPRK